MGMLANSKLQIKAWLLFHFPLNEGKDNKKIRCKIFFATDVDFFLVQNIFRTLRFGYVHENYKIVEKSFAIRFGT